MADVYAGMRIAQGGHVGGNIVEGDPLTFAPSVWTYIIERFSVRSVLDLGCGAAFSSRWFASKGLDVVAVDGMRENVERAMFPAVQIDLTKMAVTTHVDLVHCQELVEHVESQYVGNVTASLACGRVILMTHALPGQGGFHHVNEQPAQYWFAELAKMNCHMLAEDTRRVRALAQRDGAKYLAETGLVLANRNR